MKRWLWLRLTPAGRFERAAARRYQAMLDRARCAASASAARARACPHVNRVPNPAATALDPAVWRAERCLDCRTGITTRIG